MPSARPQLVPFRFAAVLGQVMRDPEHAVEILTARKVLIKPNDRDIELALLRLQRAREWVEKHAPERLRFKLLEKLPPSTKEALTELQRQALSQLADDLSKREYSPIELHNRVYDVARGMGLEPPKLFEAIYLVLIGRASGPRVGNFISALDKEFVIGRFREAAASGGASPRGSSQRAP